MWRFDSRVLTSGMWRGHSQGDCHLWPPKNGKCGCSNRPSAKTSARFPFPKPTISNGERLRKGVLEVERLAREMDQEGIRRKLRELMPEYKPAEGGETRVVPR